MIDLTYVAPNGRTSFKITIENAKQAFEALARIQAVFEEEACGCCESKNLRPQVRTTKKGDYFEWLCGDCGATLTVGQNKDGKRLFIRRTQDGQPLPNNGWKTYALAGTF